MTRKTILMMLMGAAVGGLAIVAVVTAIKLQQLGKKPMAPTARVPSRAQELVCRIAFTVTSSPTPTPTPSGSPTPTPTGSPTPTPTGSPTPTPTGFTPTPSGQVPQPELPEAGITWPTWGMVGAGGVSLLIGILTLLL